MSTARWLPLFVIASCSSPEPTTTTCSTTDTALTYAGFGDSFMASYCTGCHSSELAGSARMGAPAGYNFDSYAGIRGFANQIDLATVTNRRMPPPGRLAPSDDERALLGEWIACGLPE
jgi:uncharacterized membrane protein